MERIRNIADPFNAGANSFPGLERIFNHVYTRARHVGYEASILIAHFNHYNQFYQSIIIIIAQDVIYQDRRHHLGPEIP
jgi:hypothetical protein